MVGVSAFGDIDCCLAALGWETESPARFAGTTFLFAVLKSGDAFGVLLAGSPLGGTLLLDALLGISDGNRSGNFFDRGSVASIFGGAFGSVNCGLTSLSWET